MLRVTKCLKAYGRDMMTRLTIDQFLFFWHVKQHVELSGSTFKGRRLFICKYKQYTVLPTINDSPYVTIFPHQ